MYPKITQMDALKWAKSLPDNYATAVFCDPSYGLGRTPDMVEVLTHWLAGDDYKSDGGGFMGMAWDSFVPGPTVWRELLRACKPGAVLLAFGGTRTVDLLSVAIRLGGWEKFDEISVHGQVGLPPMIDYLYGTGYAGSADIAKHIDKEAGAERDKGIVTTPATDMARVWDGWGTRLKPAHEIVLVFRKPRQGTYAQTAVEHGTGALNIDGARIALAPDGEDPRMGGNGSWSTRSMARSAYGEFEGSDVASSPLGRWPANVILVHHEECEMVRGYRPNPVTVADGTETTVVWKCHPDCEVGKLNEKNGVRSSGTGAVKSSTGKGWQGRGYGAESREPGTPNVEYGDSGMVSRYFYQAKPSPTEREDGLLGVLPCVGCGELQSTTHVDGRGMECKCVRNTHPTLKPIALCEYLARLILPPEPYRNDAVLLVPFAGTASEMIGASMAGWRNIEGCELDEEGQYMAIAQARIAHWCSQLRLF